MAEKRPLAEATELVRRRLETIERGERGAVKAVERMRAEASKMRQSPTGFWHKLRYYVTHDALEMEAIAQTYERCAEWVEAEDRGRRERD